MTQEVMDERICLNQRYAEHITVRCRGCNALIHTKNIGRIDDKSVVHNQRSLFDYDVGCVCEDKSKEPVIHVCTIDDSIDAIYEENGKLSMFPLRFQVNAQAKPLVVDYLKKAGRRLIPRLIEQEEYKQKTIAEIEKELDEWAEKKVVLV